MSLEDDIARIALQEQRLRFTQFDATSAWELGTRLKALAEALGVALAIEVRIGRETVFFYAMPGTGPVNANWVRRKRNAVELLQRSSYGIGRGLEREGNSLEAEQGLSLRDHASHGGGFPLWVHGVGCIGCVTVSGVPQRGDHMLVVQALAAMCGVPLAEVALADEARA